MTTKAEEVWRAISEIQGALAQTGISKDNTNKQQGFTFRGIDDVYEALAPLLYKHGLCIIPEVTERIETERKTSGGKPLFCVAVKVRYTLASTKDGSMVQAIVPGEAMDMADKATNKAMSAAYKYLCIQTFCIPVKGESPDADRTTHDVAVPKSEGKAAGQEEKPSDGKKTASTVDFGSPEELREALMASADLDTLAKTWEQGQGSMWGWSEEDKKILVEAKNVRKAQLKKESE